MFDHGYRVAHAVAEENLGIGHTVIADSVNGWAVSRGPWRQVAERAAASYLEVEVVCSDPDEHRRRVETRTADIAGHRLPSWEEVVARDYEPWGADLVVDTARLSLEEAVAKIRSAVETS